MAKIALLIGVSDYGEALTSLPGTQADLQAMQRVLESSQVGAFDRVEVLPNPNRTQMEVAIETLFTDNRNRDDLIFLYFSGHGIRDDNGALYFAVSNTQKSPQGRIRTSTAVNSTALQRYMGQSRSKRQVLILDCCFSGAFANEMKAKADEAVDVKAQLGGEGRAVLTSSTATQVSYEEGASIYTRYLVQGLETGAADLDGNGQITVDELHDYAREKVQEAAPTMKPEIYAVREGYKIFIARAPQGDPKLVFRKEANERAKQKRGQLSPIDRRALKFRGQELGLAVTEVKAILDEILQPYQAFWAKLKEFEEAVKEMLEYDPQLSNSSIDDLQYFQRVLKLRDEDIASILNTHHIDLIASPSLSTDTSSNQSTASPNQSTESASSPPEVTLPPSSKAQNNRSRLFRTLSGLVSGHFEELVFALNPPEGIIPDQSAPQGSRVSALLQWAESPTGRGLAEIQAYLEQFGIKWADPSSQPYQFARSTKANSDAIVVESAPLIDDVPLKSEKGVGYTLLRDLLKAGKWKDADYATYKVMLKAAGQEAEKRSYLKLKEIRNFPCADLLTIDQLWVTASGGEFGFSVQKQIWVEVGGKLDYRKDETAAIQAYEKMSDRVKWRVDGNYISYEDVTFDTSAEPGHLPYLFVWGCGGGGGK